MEDKSKQARAYELMLELTNVPLAQRHNILTGAVVFFDRGWPSNHFTVDMAARAGMGLVPPVYEGIGTEGRYFQIMKDPSQVTESACQLAAPDFAPNCRGDRLIDDPAEPRGRRESHRIDGSVKEVRM